MLRRLSLLLVFLLTLVAPVHAQTLNATSLSAAATATATTVTVASGSGISAGHLLFVDHETMTIVSLSGTTVTVQRGLAGLAGAHGSGASVYTGPAASFFVTSPPSDACLTGQSADPYINISTGKVWVCANGYWQSLNDLPPMGAAGTVLVSNGAGKAPSAAALSGATGAGDVVGPASAVTGDVVSFSGTTGKLVADSGKVAANLVVGPASNTSGAIPAFSGTGGKTLADSAVLAAWFNQAVLTSSSPSFTKVTARLVTSGTAPAVTNTSMDSCGTDAATIVGNDNAGKVTVGATAGTSCTVTFATAFAAAPSCVVTNETTANLSRATSTTTTVILTGTFVAADVLAYACVGR